MPSNEEETNQAGQKSGGNWGDFALGFLGMANKPNESKRAKALKKTKKTLGSVLAGPDAVEENEPNYEGGGSQYA